MENVLNKVLGKDKNAAKDFLSMTNDTSCRYNCIKTSESGIIVAMKTIEDKAFKRICRKNLTESSKRLNRSK